MEGYGATSFSLDELELLRQATEIVGLLPDDDRLRCHEVARIVGQVLRLEVLDGHYGIVDHSWCMTPNRRIIDPYAVGRLPMVQLVDYVIGATPYSVERKPQIKPDVDLITRMVAIVLSRWARKARSG